MALTKNVFFQPTGMTSLITIENAYIKVLKFSGSKQFIEFEAGAFESNETKTPIRSFTFGFVPELSYKNILQECYLHLKTLPEFSGAIDC